MGLEAERAARGRADDILGARQRHEAADTGLDDDGYRGHPRRRDVPRTRVLALRHGLTAWRHAATDSAVRPRSEHRVSDGTVPESRQRDAPVAAHQLWNRR